MSIKLIEHLYNKSSYNSVKKIRKYEILSNGGKINVLLTLSILWQQVVIRLIIVLDGSFSNIYG